MEHLALEVFDLDTTQNPNPTGSQDAVLEPDATITITDTSEIFADGDVWSYDFKLNVHANAHIFGTAGDIHGSRLHEQINKRKARLWAEGVPLYLGYLKLDDEAEVDAEGYLDVSFESGQKTFDEMIADTSATEVSVGDVVIGVALNRKREPKIYTEPRVIYTLADSLGAYVNKEPWLKAAAERNHSAYIDYPATEVSTPYSQQWPKMVKSHGKVLNSLLVEENKDYTNVQTAYDDAHPFCNINICYPFKSVNEAGEEKAGRGYTVRLAHGKPTTHGGDYETRYNNAPNFYLLYFIDRLMKDLKIHVEENQCLDVQDLRRVFLLNYGCYYEEIENDNDYFHAPGHTTPQDSEEKPYLSRYGQYYLPVIDTENELYLFESWKDTCKQVMPKDIAGKVLLRDFEVTEGENHKYISSIEGVITRVDSRLSFIVEDKLSWELERSMEEASTGAYSAYLAYATGNNYPHVDISEIIEAMKAMFGVRLLFSNDYTTVRIVLLRNIFRDQSIQDINCDIVAADEKVENSIRGFRMTYGNTEDTHFYYKGFADLFPRKSKTWKDTSDKHDYSQWELNAEYNFIKQYVSAFNRTCYVTPVNGNAWGIKVDEDEDVLFPSLFEYAGFMDAEDGDCSALEDEGKTVEEVVINAKPVIMNETGIVYASLFSGEMKAPTPELYNESNATQIGTMARFTKQTNEDYYEYDDDRYTRQLYKIKGKLDVFISEGFSIRMEDNYAISNGGTPFDEADPGLCFGVMRGSGDDAFISYSDDIDDQEGNKTWEIEQGSGAVSHPDTCDNEGNLWDYDGTGEGPGLKEGRFSLKLRAEKLNPYFDPKHPESDSNRRYLEITNKNLRHRGLADQFYKEYSYWIRNARIVKRTVRMTLAQLITIDKTKRVRVGDVTGFIRKMQYSVSNETGLGNVVMEIMYI
jgi:hypothetical protein